MITGSYFEEKVTTPVYKIELTAAGTHWADHTTTLYQQKLALISPTSLLESSFLPQLPFTKWSLIKQIYFSVTFYYNHKTHCRKVRAARSVMDLPASPLSANDVTSPRS
jgi:hypothetical protein